MLKKKSFKNSKTQKRARERIRGEEGESEIESRRKVKQ